MNKKKNTRAGQKKDEKGAKKGKEAIAKSNKSGVASKSKQIKGKEEKKKQLEEKKKDHRMLEGIPIVDAGMRELWQTGYIHNRVRMIVEDADPDPGGLP